MDNLFSEFKLGNKTLKNRIVVPPMVCFFKEVENGNVCKKTIEHYANVSKDGAGLVIVEATCISPSGRLNKTQLGAWDDAQIEGLKKLSDAIHANGAVALLQIHHAGIKSVGNAEGTSFAPSDYTSKMGNGREMTLEEIETTIKQFAQSAIRAQKAGFDGVEIHGCHSYLLSQFMSPTINKRVDEYGKDMGKLPTEVISAVRNVVDKDFIVGIRTSGNDPSMEASINYAKQFEAAGADYLHVSTGFGAKRPDDFQFDEQSKYTFILQMGMDIKKHVSIPVIVVNGIKQPEQARYLIDNNLAELVAVGKSQIADTNWAHHAQRGVSVDACLECPRCFCFSGIENCVKRTIETKFKP